MRDALLQSELRVRDPAQALLFYVPVFEFASAHLGACGNTSHGTRMAAANTALLASPWWQRHGGRDHLLASSAFSFGSGALYVIVWPPKVTFTVGATTHKRTDDCSASSSRSSFSLIACSCRERRVGRGHIMSAARGNACDA